MPAVVSWEGAAVFDFGVQDAWYSESTEKEGMSGPITQKTLEMTLEVKERLSL